jgi:hypothetical protein
MAKSFKLRDNIRSLVIKKAAQMYKAKNFNTWGVNKIYDHQIEDVWEKSYAELAKKHPRMKWLNELSNHASKNIKLKFIMIIPGKDLNIKVPDYGGTKLTAIAHFGGTVLLKELIDIIINLDGYPLPGYR